MTSLDKSSIKCFNYFAFIVDTDRNLVCTLNLLKKHVTLFSHKII